MEPDQTTRDLTCVTVPAPLPELPTSIEGVSYLDIPKKYYHNDKALASHGLNIDATFKDSLRCLSYIRNVPDSEAKNLKRKIGYLFAPQNDTGERAMSTLSVRSAYDLYLQTKNFPKNSEVIMTGINIPDMLQITQEYGLVPVPVDLNVDTLQPDLEQIQAVTTEKTVCCLMAMILGITYDITQYAEFLHPRGIDIIEDCAQSWQGLDTFRGSPYATMTMFSFGTIKHNTCYYGGIIIIREQANLASLPAAKNLCKQMIEKQETYPTYERSAYRKKVSQMMALSRVLNIQPIVATAQKVFKWQGKDLEDFMTSQIRGFKKEDNFLQKFRIQPNAPLLKMMYEKTRHYNKETHARKLVNFQLCAKILLDQGFFVPGSAVKDRSYWLFPFPVQNKQQFRAFSQENGINCYRGTTQLTSLPVPDCKKNIPGYRGNTSCDWLMNNSVYLSVTSTMCAKEFDIFMRRQMDILHRYNLYLKQVERIVRDKQVPQVNVLPRAKL